MYKGTGKVDGYRVYGYGGKVTGIRVRVRRKGNGYRGREEGSRVTGIKGKGNEEG